MKRASDGTANGATAGIRNLQLAGWLACFFAILLLCPMAQATEGGGSAYPGGNEDFMAGALPPAGHYPILYNMYYTSDELVDNDGNELPVDFDLDVFVSALRYVYVSPYKLFGADLGWHIIVPFISQDVEIGALGVDESTSGIGDIEFSTLIFGWHFSKNMHLVATVDIFAPIGEYDQNDPSSIGRNYWTVDPIVAATYISDGGFEVSAKFQYLINFENSDTDYTSGNEFICDYLIGQHVGKWNFGVNGVIYQQITDDELDGDTVEDYKAQCFSIGPAIQYNYKNMFFNLKAQFDTAAENRPEGKKFWFKLMYAF